MPEPNASAVAAEAETTTKNSQRNEASAGAPSADAPSAERECSGGHQMTSLQKAALSGDVAALERALECTAANVDAIGADGRTALMIAAANGHVSLVTALCNAGVDMEQIDGEGLTALSTPVPSGPLIGVTSLFWKCSGLRGNQAAARAQ